MAVVQSPVRLSTKLKIALISHGHQEAPLGLGKPDAEAWRGQTVAEPLTDRSPADKTPAIPAIKMMFLCFRATYNIPRLIQSLIEIKQHSYSPVVMNSFIACKEDSLIIQDCLPL